MRSRYSAFALGDSAYLAASWHPDFRPADVGVDRSLRWVGLSILGSDLEARPAIVEFEARFLAAGRLDALRERSRFVLDAGRWWYTDGDRLPPVGKPRQPGRNEPCPCGSGLKFKRCCAGGSG